MRYGLTHADEEALTEAFSQEEGSPGAASTRIFRPLSGMIAISPCRSHNTSPLEFQGSDRKMSGLQHSFYEVWTVIERSMPPINERTRRTRVGDQTIGRSERP